MYRAFPLVIATAPVLPAGARVDTVLAAPGVGLLYRIVGWQIGMNRATTGIADFVLQDGAPNSIAAAMGLSIGGLPSFAPPIPEPGLPCGVNQPLQISLSSSAAAGNYRCTVYYFIDVSA